MEELDRLVIAVWLLYGCLMTAAAYEAVWEARYWTHTNSHEPHTNPASQSSNRALCLVTACPSLHACKQDSEPTLIPLIP